MMTFVDIAIYVLAGIGAITVVLVLGAHLHDAFTRYDVLEKRLDQQNLRLIALEHKDAISPNEKSG